MFNGMTLLFFYILENILFYSFFVCSLSIFFIPENFNLTSYNRIRKNGKNKMKKIVEWFFLNYEKKRENDFR